MLSAASSVRVRLSESGFHEVTIDRAAAAVSTSKMIKPSHPLRYSIGQRIMGCICDADEAYERLTREVWRLSDNTMWIWFADRLNELESALIALGGYDHDLAEQIDEHGYFGPSEVFDEHMKTAEVMFDIESLTGAFFVTLAPRLNAVRVAAKRVFDDARKLDSIAVSDPQRIGNDDFNNAIAVANFIKHRDEWVGALSGQQQRTFDSLVALGVASATAAGVRNFDSWPIVCAARAIGGQTTISQAVQDIAAQCKRAGDAILDEVQRQFEPHTAALAARREANVPLRKIRLQSGAQTDES